MMFSRSNSNFSILTQTFSKDGFYNSRFQNDPSENSAASLVILISKDANLVFYLSVYPLFHSSN